VINIQETSQITKIYLVTNCYGDPNKVYIGKTQNCRKYPHRITYGNDIIYDYIDEIESLDSKDWKPLESFWINYFKFLGFEVLNKNDGGGGNTTVSEETKLKIKISSIGQKRSDETKIKMSISRKGRIHSEKSKIQIGINKRKEVLQYNLDGTFIKEWRGIKEVSKTLGLYKNGISSCYSGRINSCGGFIWRLKDNPIDNKINFVDGHSIPIKQYNIDGKFIKDWDSIIRASLSLNISAGCISKCCKNKLKTSGGFIWKYKND
jgi:hypothetical protein